MPDNLLRKTQDQVETNAALQSPNGAESMAEPSEDLFDEFLADNEDEN